jgi:hypothetical protein
MRRFAKTLALAAALLTGCGASRPTLSDAIDVMCEGAVHVEAYCARRRARNGQPPRAPACEPDDETTEAP